MRTLRRESKDERETAKYVAQAGGLMLKWVSPGFSGVPDRILFPGDGRILFIEWKRPGEQPSTVQRIVAFQLDKLGFKVHVIHNMEEFFELCRIERLAIYRRWLSLGLVHTPAE